MKFKCPECAKVLKVKDEMAGRKGRCPACKAMVVVPRQKPKPLRPQKTDEGLKPPPLRQPDHVFDLIQEGRKKYRWRLTLFPERLNLVSDDAGDSIEITPDSATKELKNLSLLGKQFFLHIKKTKKKLAFKINAQIHDCINQWLGEVIALKIKLQQRIGLGLPIGILYVLISLPTSDVPDSYLGPIPYRLITLILGTSLIALAILMKVKPHRSLFLADSAWFFMLFCLNLLDIVKGDVSIYWSALAVIQLYLVVTGVGLYRYFGAHWD